VCVIFYFNVVEPPDPRSWQRYWVDLLSVTEPAQSTSVKIDIFLTLVLLENKSFVDFPSNISVSYRMSLDVPRNVNA